MTRTRAALRDTALTCLGGLVAIAVLAPQLHDARAHVDRLEDNEARLAHVCTFRPDGSAACPAGAFHIDRVKQVAR